MDKVQEPNNSKCVITCTIKKCAKIEWDEMGGVCGVHGRDGKFMQNFVWKESVGLGDLGKGGKIRK
jgi:hypothetical protein